MEDVDSQEAFDNQVLALIGYAVDKYADGNLDNFYKNIVQ